MPNMIKLNEDGQIIEASAPGRICLFGEHQDYLRLPVIAAAIDLRITLTGYEIEGEEFELILSDLGKHARINPNKENPYTHDRDYLVAAANVLRRQGLRWNHSFRVEVRSEIPINAGASSSSALQVAWCAFLLKAAGDIRAEDPMAIAELAYLSEVVEFNSPGGRMDHYATAVGGIIWLDCKEPFELQHLPSIEGRFLLVDSGIPKDTNGVLGTIRQSVESLGVDFTTITEQHSSLELEKLASFDQQKRRHYNANLQNKSITQEAYKILSSTQNPKRIGTLLNKHHQNLISLGVSHPAIDEYLSEGIQLGACGGKINGSGGGGSFFFYGAGELSYVRKQMALRKLRSWEVSIGSGVRVEHKEKLKVSTGS